MPLARPVVEEDVAGVVRFYNFASPGGGFPEDVLHGLAAKQKTIPIKYCHDERGRELFERVCERPEYYLARAEMAIMRANFGEMAQLLGPNCQLIEFGCGSSVRTRLLIEAANPSLYVPIDIAETQLKAVCGSLSTLMPRLNVMGLIVDYTRGLALPEFAGVPVGKKAVFFPGSAIGAFTPFEAQAFLAMARRTVGSGGILLIGVDLRKDGKLLDAAYNDEAGAFAELNLNLLERINSEMDGDFQVQRFRHKAFYDEAKGWVEMRLESEYSQLVHVAGRRFDFAPAEAIHTGIACKYSIEEFQNMARLAHFHPEKVWTDPENQFSVHGMIAV
jgi:dimethylhistidine N-methyltransferase